MAKKILIIEDDEMLRGIMTQRLAGEHYNVVQAVDGSAGLQAIKDEKPDLVLLDLMLPIMDGFNVLEAAKKDDAISSIPIVILSNLSQKEDIERAMKLGAHDYWIKIEFASDEIMEKIREIIK
jgi:DNA-binding response OmpR family regulator